MQRKREHDRIYTEMEQLMEGELAKDSEAPKKKWPTKARLAALNKTIIRRLTNELEMDASQPR